ncbi:MAG: hypothetical protein ACREOQ_13460 [Gemmatimonadales bacterium]
MALADRLGLPAQIRQGEAEEGVALRVLGRRPDLLVKREARRIRIDRDSVSIAPQVVQLGHDDRPGPAIAIERARPHGEHPALSGIVEQPVQVLIGGEEREERVRVDAGGGIMKLALAPGEIPAGQGCHHLVQEDLNPGGGGAPAIDSQRGRGPV